MQLEDGAGVSGSVHGAAGLPPSLPPPALGISSGLWTSPQALPPPRPLAAAPRPTVTLEPSAGHAAPWPGTPAATRRVHASQETGPPVQTPQHAQHDAGQWEARQASAAWFRTPDDAAPHSGAGLTVRPHRQPSLDGSGPLVGAHRGQFGGPPIGHSANRRKRSSCDSRTGSTDAAGAARSAAQLVAAAASTPRRGAWERGSLSGPLEDGMHGSVTGSARVSAQSEPLSAAFQSDCMHGGAGRAGSDRRSPRTTGAAAAAARRSLLRQRSGGSARLPRRGLRGADADRSSSGALPESAAVDAAEAQHAATAAALPPLFAMEGRLRPLPKAATTVHPRDGGLRPTMQRWPSTGLPFEAIREGAMEVPAPEANCWPELPSTVVFSAGLAHLDTPCEDTLPPPAGAGGSRPGPPAAGVELRGQPGLQPATPFTTPRSPSPQRLCRRDGTPTVPSLAPAAAQHVQPDFGLALGGRGSGGAAGEPGASAHQLRRPEWMRAQEDPEDRKRRLAVQRFNRELHCRLAAQGIDPLTGAELAPAPSLVRPQAGPRPPQPTDRRRERQFVDKERLEESTLSALAALMKR